MAQTKTDLRKISLESILEKSFNYEVFYSLSNSSSKILNVNNLVLCPNYECSDSTIFLFPSFSAKSSMTTLSQLSS